MILDATPDHMMIRTEAARLLANRSSSEAVRRVVDSGGGTDRALWDTVARELGWCGMAIPEAYGGLGLGTAELAILLEATGERLACIPLFATTCLATPLLLAAAGVDAKQRFLPGIASGDISATVAYPSLGTEDPLAGLAVTAVRTADGYVLSGIVAHVIDLASVELVIVPAICDGELALFALTAADRAGVMPRETLDATRPVASLILSDLAVPFEARIDDGCLTASTVEAALAFAHLGLAAEGVGAAQGALDATLAYIVSRVQFGRTIASFQAVKHRCAKLVVGISEARSLLYGPAAALGDDDAGTRLEVLGARVAAGDVQYQAAEEAIQLHGGVGFTWEYDAHLYFKRAQASAALFGSQEARLERVARSLLDEGIFG